MRASRSAPWRAALAALGVVILAGCVSAPRRPTRILPWPQRRARLRALNAFELSGRVAVVANGQGFDANLHWRQQGTRSRIDLSGPLGLGGVQVVANGPRLDVATSGGRKLTSAQAREQLTASLGFEPPLGSLRYWLLGVPDPAAPCSKQLDPQHRIAAMQQKGWRIDYLRYMPAGGYWLPQRVTLRRGGVRVRLLIGHWQP